MNKFARFLVAGVVVSMAAWFPVSLGAENLIRNPGFESGGKDKLTSWDIPTYWSGTMVGVSDEGAARSGKRAAHLVATETRGKHWGRIRQASLIRVALGRRYRFSMWARGSGSFVLGCIHYSKQKPGEKNYRYEWQDPKIQLTDTWQQIVLDITVEQPDTLRLGPCAEVRGKGAAAFLDDSSFSQYVVEGYELHVSAHHPAAVRDTEIEIEVYVTKSGHVVTEGSLLVQRVLADGKVEKSSVAITGTGIVSVSVTAAGAKEEGTCQSVIVHPASGAVRAVTVDVFEPEEFKVFEAASSAVRGMLPEEHILFLGDSLTDFMRGSNYVDKVDFWLKRSTGGKVTVRNAGVGGDYITRVWQRLSGDDKAYRANMYEDLYSPRPSRVFFFLGHNDSKVSSRSDYTKPMVAVDVFEKEYRQAVEKVRAECGSGTITLISATSSVYEITKASADKRAAAGKAHNLFGRPDELEAFNAAAKRVAEGLGCGYIDVYAPTRDHPDKPSLFTADGVHVNNRGNRIIALEILRHLGRK